MLSQDELAQIKRSVLARAEIDRALAAEKASADRLAAREKDKAERRRDALRRSETLRGFLKLLEIEK